MGYLTTELLAAVEKIAQDAGRAVMQIYGRAFRIEEKADKSPLTEADAAAHQLILARLQALSPALPILSEEDVDAFPGADEQGRYWLVDPLDGTKEFIKRNGEFTVNIALIERGVPVLGVVYAPVPGVTYSAARGLGAVKIGADNLRRPITVATHRTDTAWRVLGSRSHPSQQTHDWLARLDRYEMVALGSSLKLCLVAEGAADLYPRLGPTALWDTAAGHAVVNGAGGEVLRLDDEPLSYADTSELLNPWFIVYGDRRALLQGK